MYNSREVANPFKLTVIVPEPLQQILFQVMDAAIFIVLAWYFDNVLAGEHGSPRPFYFFLTADYWGCKRKKPSARRGRDDDVIVEDHSEDYDSDVESERRKVEDMADSPFDERTEAVRIVNLTKEYRKYALCRTKTDTKAVNNVSMSINNGEIFCLLGHNGAGKTTTINMLTGLFKPSSGDAYVYGYDIDNEMDSIRCGYHYAIFLQC
jgi:ABC-type transport system involved in cytochrome bd biosynthesis fused ATPase/permease subunit